MVCFEVSRRVQRRIDLAADLPSEHPGVLDEIGTLMLGLPDVDMMCAEERAHKSADSRVLHAGTTGMLVAVATGQKPQAGSALVHRGNQLRELPLVRRAFGAGSLSAAHVTVITADAGRITDFAAIEADVVTSAEAVEPAELRRLLQLQCRATDPGQRQRRSAQAPRVHASHRCSVGSPRLQHAPDRPP